MANNKFTYQQQTNVSIPRRDIIDIAGDQEFKQDDFRVILALFSTLDGWDPEQSRTPDPRNFKAIKVSQIADLTGVPKKKVKESLDKLLRRNYIAKGSNETVTDGYRFTF